jgi:predicted glycoside hydrolase/deacetylase ChbG (UPF0249 family)
MEYWGVNQMKLIINADDYGISISTTKAILEAFNKGLCSSTTIMATGDAFEEAVELAINNHITDKIGLHINLIEGKPLSQLIRKQKKFCNQDGFFNGNFHFKSARLSYLSSEEKEAVSLEIKAQIEKCLKTGIVLSHVDSHHHIHTRWEVWQAIKPVIRSYNINKVRISRNCGENISTVKYLYKFLFNKQLRLVDLKTTDYFGNITDIENLLSKNKELINKNVVAELMIHPIYNASKELVDSNKISLEEINKIIRKWDITSGYSSYFLLG